MSRNKTLLCLVVNKNSQRIAQNLCESAGINWHSYPLGTQLDICNHSHRAVIKINLDKYTMTYEKYEQRTLSRLADTCDMMKVALTPESQRKLLKSEGFLL